MNVDFCVIGGGLAGVTAAVCAARHGAKVALVQDRSVLGGNASSEIRMHIVGADCHGRRPGARETGFMEEIRLEDAVKNSHRSFPLWDVLLYDKVISEPNIQLFLNTHFTACECAEIDGSNTIVSALVARPSTEEEFEIHARFFADCSGDGVLGAAAGADFRIGRESREEFDEPKAQEKADRQTLGNSILFTGRRLETPQVFHAPDWVRKFTKDDLRLRPIGSYEYGFWWAEWGGELDTIADNDKIRHENLRITLGVWDYIKNSGDYPDSANWVLDWIGAIPGKRESRRFLGPHILTQSDIESGRVFADQVAYGGWWLDLHPPAGMDAIDEPPCVQHHIPHLFGIPLSSLYSRNVGNLFFAGRNVSATHVAFASTRVMGTCAVMGQAIGTAAALWKDVDGTVSEISDPQHLAQLQLALQRDDAFLPGLVVKDQEDLALSAKIWTDSETSDAPADSVINGVSRATNAAWGPWSADRTNRWESSALPARLELTWDAPESFHEVHLTFCTGMHRELTLTASDHLTSRMTRCPQPETVRDYDILIDGVVALEVRDNFLRKRRHLLPDGSRGEKLEIRVISTHGLDRARLYEVRVYAGTTLP